MTLLIDPLGMCLLRELVEAAEACDVSYDAYRQIELLPWDAVNRIEVYREWGKRVNKYDRLAIEFHRHLILFPCEQIDVSDGYFDHIATQAIELYKSVR